MPELITRIAERCRWEWREFRRPSAPTFLQEELDHVLLKEIVWRPGERVLDVGCGKGQYLEALRKQGASVCGMDLDKGALNKISSERDRICGSALSLPFRDNAFDVVLCHKSLYLFDDPVRAAEELTRVTRTGGRLVASTSHPRSPYSIAQQFALNRTQNTNWRKGNRFGPKEWITAFRRAGLVPMAVYSCNLIWPLVFRICDTWLIPNEWMRRYTRFVRRTSRLSYCDAQPLPFAQDYIIELLKPERR